MFGPQLEPAERIVFKTSGGGETVLGSIKITNTLVERIAYKVKTSSNDLFRIASPCGVLMAGESVLVAITFLGDNCAVLPVSGHHHFTVQYIKVNGVHRLLEDTQARRYWSDHKGPEDGVKRLPVDFQVQTDPAATTTPIPSCPVCIEKYTDANFPRSFVCGHSVCTGCVDMMWTMRTTQNVPVQCPICRFAHPGLVKPPPNFLVKETLKILADMEKVTNDLRRDLQEATAAERTASRGRSRIRSVSQNTTASASRNTTSGGPRRSARLRSSVNGTSRRSASRRTDVPPGAYQDRNGRWHESNGKFLKMKKN